MINDGITLKKLEIFLIFMKSGTLKNTAELLGLSPVAVHKALHSLEESMNCPLFKHEGRVLLPLSSAHTLAQHTENILNQLDIGIRETQEKVNIYSNNLRLGTLYSLTFDMVPKVLNGLKNRNPSLKVSLYQGSNEFLYQQLESMKLDIILIALTPGIKLPGYITMDIYEDEMIVAVSKKSKLVKYTHITLEQLKNERLITLNHGFATYHDCMKCFYNSNINPKIYMQVGDIYTLLTMIESNIGYSIVPQRVQEKYNKDIHFIKIKNKKNIKQIISLVCLESKERDPKILNCIAECRLYALNHFQNKKLHILN